MNITEIHVVLQPGWKDKVAVFFDTAPPFTGFSADLAEGTGLSWALTFEGRVTCLDLSKPNAQVEVVK